MPRVFTVVIEVPDQTLEDDTFQSALQSVVNQVANDTRIISTSHVDE